MALAIGGIMPAVAAGFLEVRSFVPSAYAGGAQNWAMCQDSVGRAYFANNAGMLSFDGERWNVNPLPNYSTVRTLLYEGDDDRIYAAGTEEFGYFAPDPSTGVLRYTSLMPSLPRNHPAFTEVWNI
ncbi:MAG: hypothetical protein K2G66_00530, partial [Alistipes sp.]|nr:hypothetical protein [Alistipes sp.]